jgi:hydroxymethylpyrimidine/phosphomethylpyrimidine kinase
MTGAAEGGPVRGRVLIVAGSDSGGGAGIQADIKTVTALGGYAETAVTALTAQDTRGVHAVRPVDPAFVALQMELVLADLGADAIKTGMMVNTATIDAVCDVIERKAPELPLVVDPVMIATGGQALLDADAIATLKRRLMFLATLVTPNVPEAEALTGFPITSLETMTDAAYMIPTLGCKAALIKGGHLEGPVVVDILATSDGIELFEHPRIESRHTHGTGCTLASAIATGLAQGLGLRDAVARGRAFLQEAIRTAPGFGQGHGPLNHAHTVRPFTAP